MPDLISYAKHEVPREVAAQIRSYVRVQWPQFDGPGGRLWDVPRGRGCGGGCGCGCGECDARTFVVLDGELLVSHAEANFRDVAHGGGTYRVGGLSAVFTYPAWRGRGHARRAVRAATQFLDASDADLGMLFCDERLRGFYETCGWTSAPDAKIEYGEPTDRRPCEDGIVMMRFVSGKGRAARATLERERLYVGERTW